MQVEPVFILNQKLVSRTVNMLDTPTTDKLWGLH